VDIPSIHNWAVRVAGIIDFVAVVRDENPSPLEWLDASPWLRSGSAPKSIPYRIHYLGPDVSALPI
jgi:hypothetical protein